MGKSRCMVRHFGKINLKWNLSRTKADGETENPKKKSRWMLYEKNSTIIVFRCIDGDG